MDPRLTTTTVDFTPLLLVGWQMAFPFGDMQYAPEAMIVIAAAMVVRLVAREVRSKRERVLVLGSGPMAVKLIEEIEAARPQRYDVAGVVDDQTPDAESPLARHWRGICDELPRIVRESQPACIVLAAADRRSRLPLQSLLESRVRGIVVEDALDFYERLTGKIAIEALRPSVLIMSKGFRNHGPAETTARVVSMVVAVIGLILCAPLLALLALLVKLDSRGPVFFYQPRAGRDGHPFDLIKFRTMHPTDNAPSEWVSDNIHRITRVGRWLRRFRLDELPQLVNVLRGEMNLIGPRPHPVSNHAVFMDQIAYYGLRASVRPGVTGWAQVRYGYANNLEEETEKMRYDLFYIKNRSIWLDTRILFETVGIMAFGTGASEVRRPSPSRSALVPSAAIRSAADETPGVGWLPAPTPGTTAGPR